MWLVWEWSTTILIINIKIQNAKKKDLTALQVTTVQTCNFGLWSAVAGIKPIKGKGKLILLLLLLLLLLQSSMARIFPCSGESITTECEVNYQLLAVIYWSSPMSCCQLQFHPPPYTGQCSLISTYCTVQMLATNRKTCCSSRGPNTRPWVCQTNALPVRPLMVFLIN